MALIKDCSNAHDLYLLVYTRESRVSPDPYELGPDNTWRPKATLSAVATRMVEEIHTKWMRLLTSDNKRRLKKHHFLTIEYDAVRHELHVKSLPPGRPMDEHKKGRAKGVRLDPNLQVALTNYCSTYNMTESKVIRQALKSFLSDTETHVLNDPTK